MKDTLYAIYKFDFHQATNRSVIAESNGVDGSKNVKFAQKCWLRCGSPWIAHQAC